ncbi:Lar family restriction alleviation protein [Salmonella enterica]|nr:Lar family restriction alleviation protein [Salmonella enterica]EHV3526368.1 Lar family restriction alleviation protein [Salmonella enterica]EHW6083229.1 Lar family restriction alleviation protein [Salmonella enterica]EHZ7563089.1 Lar family restriction alleviation protein [Salmonella enterica]EIP5378080.1 Lar family restriction alleviation protein [Salmonella enterica]
MKENQITTSMAKDIAFKLGAVLNDEEAEIFADGYNAALLKVNKNASTELPNYANLSTSSQAAPDDSVLLPCPFCGSPAEHYPDGDMEGYIIMCGNKNGDCNLQAFGFTTPEEAEKAWNTRAAMLQGGQPVSNRDELSSPVIPDGYALVPIVPTEDMVINGFESEPDPHFSDEKVWAEYEALSGCRRAARRAELCWAAMIKAAPKQEGNNG